MGGDTLTAASYGAAAPPQQHRITTPREEQASVRETEQQGTDPQQQKQQLDISQQQQQQQQHGTNNHHQQQQAQQQQRRWPLGGTMMDKQASGSLQKRAASVATNPSLRRGNLGLAGGGGGGGGGALPGQQQQQQQRQQHNATPLLAIILWSSMASVFPIGYTIALSRDVIFSLPGLSESMQRRDCGDVPCAPEDALSSDEAHQMAMSVLHAGLAAGAVAGAWLLKSYGRRAALMAAHATFIASFALAAAARNYDALIAGLTGTDAAAGVVFVATVLVDAELAPAHRRLAFVTAALTLAYGLGMSCASSLGLAQTALPREARLWFWRAVVAAGAWPCMLLLGILPFVPESPFLLVARGRTAEALQTLADLRGPFVDTAAELRGIVRACAESEGEYARARRGRAALGRLVPAQLRLLLSRRHRPSLVVTVLLAALCALQSSAIRYARMLEVEVRHSFDELYSWAVARFLTPLVVPLGGALALAVGTDRFSRRVLIAGGVAVLVPALAGLAVLNAAPYGTEDLPPYPQDLVAAVFALSAVASLASDAALMPACFLLPAELAAAGVRGAAVAAFFVTYQAVRVGWDLAASAKAVADLDYVAATCTGALVTLLTVLVWLFVPEGTQRAPLEECRYAWQRHWYWGRRAERWAMDLPQLQPQPSQPQPLQLQQQPSQSQQNPPQPQPSQPSQPQPLQLQQPP